MANINIVEQDLTKPAISAQVTDVVYVPIFVTTAKDKQKGRYFPSTPEKLNDLLPVQTDAIFKVQKNYASKLIEDGLTVLVDIIEPVADQQKETALDNALTEIDDLGEVDVKYITSGGYVDGNRTVYQILLKHSIARNDCVALFDEIKTPVYTGSDKNNIKSYFEKNDYTLGAQTGTALQYLDGENIATYDGSYGAAFTPWMSFDDIEEQMPASFAYLRCLANTLKSQPNYLAIAGVNRGLIPHAKDYANAADKISNKAADDMQVRSNDASKTGIAINAITKINDYGYCIMGNRTTRDNIKPKGAVDGMKASSFLNTRNMSNEIKKLAYTTCQALRFEQSSDTLWHKFVSIMSPYMESLKYGGGLRDYRLALADKKSTGEALGKGEFAAQIRIVPIYAVESFDITIELADGEVSIN